MWLSPRECDGTVAWTAAYTVEGARHGGTCFKSLLHSGRQKLCCLCRAQCRAQQVLSSEKQACNHGLDVGEKGVVLVRSVGQLSLGLELQMVLSHRVGTGGQTQAS